MEKREEFCNFCLIFRQMDHERESELVQRLSHASLEHFGDVMTKVMHAYIHGVTEHSNVHLVVACLASTGCKLAELYDPRITFKPYAEIRDEKQCAMVSFGSDVLHVAIGQRKQLSEQLPSIIVQSGVFRNTKKREWRARHKKAVFQALDVTKPLMFLSAKAVFDAIAEIRKHAPCSEESVAACMNMYFPASHKQAERNFLVKWRSTFLRKVYVQAVSQIYIPLIRRNLDKATHEAVITASLLCLAATQDCLWYQIQLDIQAESWAVCKENPDLLNMYLPNRSGANHYSAASHRQWITG